MHSKSPQPDAARLRPLGVPLGLGCRVFGVRRLQAAAIGAAMYVQVAAGSTRKTPRDVDGRVVV